MVSVITDKLRRQMLNDEDAVDTDALQLELPQVSRMMMMVVVVVVMMELRVGVVGPPSG